MEIEFIGSRPRRRDTRAKLKKVLCSNELNAAVAFCTGAGVEILKKDAHALDNPDSFLVVADSPCTDIEALRELQGRVGGEILIHFGAMLPKEIKASAIPLMHAKLFLGKDRAFRRLWAGSHNLTGAAIAGVNYEAALSLTGQADEEVFAEAQRYLDAIRGQSIPIKNVPIGTGGGPGVGKRVHLLVIHAESDGLTPKDGDFVHLCLPAPCFDPILRPPTELILFLYPPGCLNPARPDTNLATQAFGGNVTALNFTAQHPNKGTPADWQGARFMIDAQTEKPVLVSPPQLEQWVVSQSVFRLTLSRPEMAGALLLAAKPKVELSTLGVEREPFEIDDDLLEFFTKPSLMQGGGLRFHPVDEVAEQVSVSSFDCEAYRERILEKLGPDSQIVDGGEIRGFAGSPCIHIARYCFNQ